VADLGRIQPLDLWGRSILGVWQDSGMWVASRAPKRGCPALLHGEEWRKMGLWWLAAHRDHRGPSLVCWRQPATRRRGGAPSLPPLSRWCGLPGAGLRCPPLVSCVFFWSSKGLRPLICSPFFWSLAHLANIAFLISNRGPHIISRIDKTTLRQLFDPKQSRFDLINHKLILRLKF